LNSSCLTEVKRKKKNIDWKSLRPERTPIRKIFVELDPPDLSKIKKHKSNKRRRKLLESQPYHKVLQETPQITKINSMYNSW